MLHKTLKVLLNISSFASIQVLRTVISETSNLLKRKPFERKS